MTSPSYLSDLTDDEWLIIKPLIQLTQKFGHPRTVNLRPELLI